ncbi:hypothetical protein [Streptomyces sp. JV178]|uniref:hypothetical protein n=1 Tax=Streptomyces sp. JV178 TaxID=858632 RepID=UPI00117C135D|nr:hypothetical protein [Streptomyces sp. JV178]
MSRPPSGDPDLPEPPSPDWAALAETAEARHRRRRLILFVGGLAATFALGVVAALITFSVGSGGSPPREKPPGSGGHQQEYIERLDDAREHLFRSRLAYSNPHELELTEGETAAFRVTITGGWQPLEADGTPRTGTEVRAGAEIAVRLHCSGAEVTCPALSSSRQSVLTKKDSATWRWQITPKKAGTVALNLTVTAYYLDTDTVLFEKFVAVGSVKAAQAEKDSGPSTWPGILFGWAKDAVMITGTLAGSLGAVVALILAVKSLRRPGSGQAGGADEV